MHCAFHLSRPVHTATENNVTGTIALTAKSEVKDVKTITYGVKVCTKLKWVCDYQEGLRSPREGTPEPEWTRPGFHEDKIRNKLYLSENDLIDEMISSNQTAMTKFKFNEKDFTIPAGTSIAAIINCQIKPSDQLWLPSSNDLYGEYQFACRNPVMHVEYFLFVRVKRISTIFKRLKYDELTYPIRYIGECQFKPPPGIFKHELYGEFVNKKPKPDIIDQSTGCYEGGKLNTAVVKKKMFSKVLKNGWRSKTLPLIINFTANTIIDINRELFEQSSLTLSFDLLNYNFPMDFKVGKSSSGLGLFEIHSLDIEISYEIYNSSGKRPYTTDFHKFYGVELKGLIFDIKDCNYDPRTHRGTFEITKDMFRAAGNEMIIGDTCLPFFTSCKTGMGNVSHSMLRFVWKIDDSDDRIPFEFVTRCSITG